MAITKTITNSGNLTTTSSNGAITLDQTSGELVIRRGSRRAVVIDSDGFSYYDITSTRRISIGQNDDGQVQIVVYEGDTGIARILVGQDPADGEPIIAVSEAGKDVIEALNG